MGWEGRGGDGMSPGVRVHPPPLAVATYLSTSSGNSTLAE